MSVPSFLYQLLLAPLILLFEVVYDISYLLLNNPGAAILPLSLVVNLLLLPFYQRADAIQREERECEERLAPGIAHLKQTFRGDERYMMLQTYYRQNHYKPVYALKSSLPLLLEIPFFISAYRFLSQLVLLRGASFGPLRDLGAPDGLLQVAGMTVNLLPILMTVINIVSSEIYTKGMPVKEKLKLHAMALIFLVLLYRSPSGLVLYWTLNNVFSLGKNLVMTARDPRRLVRIFLSVAGAALLVLDLLLFRDARLVFPLLLFMGLAMQLPLILKLTGKMPLTRRELLPELSDRPGRFMAGCLFLTVLTGLLIPSEVVFSSPDEFVLSAEYHAPILHVVNSFLLAAGFFLIWLGLFYFLSAKPLRRLLDYLIWVVGGCGILNYMFFATKLGTLSRELHYDNLPSFTAREQLINLVVLSLFAVLLGVVWLKKKSLIRPMATVLILAVLGMSGYNMASIQAATPAIREKLHQPGPRADIPLSRDGKNVVVLMLDRAIGRYVPYLFQEKPELREQFAGFTWYPDTLSHGNCTLIGSPGLYGGYEYTPAEMNRRKDEKLVDKHDEALMIMPLLFYDAGYQVTVCDQSFARYATISDLSIYDPYPGIRTFITEEGEFNTQRQDLDTILNSWRRNFFCFSIMKISPLVLQPRLYQYGYYFNPDPGARTYQTVLSDDFSVAEGINRAFNNSFSVLHALPEITHVEPGDDNTFLILTNSTTHREALLQEPEYVPSVQVDNTEYELAHEDRFTYNGVTMAHDDLSQICHYQINMAALIQLGNWFDYLREQGVYDNTRIILVADHGKALLQFEDMILDPELDVIYYPYDTAYYNPLFMVKDFGETEFRVDMQFMTNADTPVLATEGLVDNPVNPFTGKPINSDAKAGVQEVFYTRIWNPTKNPGNTFDGGRWLTVHDSMLDLANWTILDHD